MIPLFSESEKGTAGFVDGVHGPRKGRTPGEKTTRGLHVQDRSEIAASPPFALIPSSVSAERELGKEIRLSVWPLFALSHHFVVWYCADKVYPGKKFSKYALLDNDIVIGDAAVADVYKDLINHLGVISLAVTSQFGGDQNRSLCSLIEAVLSSRRNSEFTVVSYPRLVSK